jgi:hypothetical protein
MDTLRRRARKRRALAIVGSAALLGAGAACSGFLGIEPLMLAVDAMPGAPAMEGGAPTEDGSAEDGGAEAAASDASIDDAPILDVADVDANAADACFPRPEGLVHWYRAENDAKDSVSGVVARWFGEPTYEKGYVGQAFSFECLEPFEDGGRAVIADLLGLVGPFTLDMWTLIRSVGPICAAFSTDDQDTDYTNAIDLRTDIGAQNYIFDLPPGVDGSPGPISASGAVQDAWVHFAVTFDGSHVSLYRAGALVASESSLPRTGMLILGAFSATGKRGWPGLIDEVHFYNRPLRADEIAAIALAPSGFCP